VDSKTYKYTFENSILFFLKGDLYHLMNQFLLNYSLLESIILILHLKLSINQELEKRITNLLVISIVFIQYTYLS